MLLLHTSDWHIGRRFHQVDLLDAQAAYLDHLAQVVRDRNVTAVLVAGDIYDRAMPPVKAISVLDNGLDQLLAAGAQVVATAGNHDSAVRLGFGSKRNELAGLHLRVGPTDALRPVTLQDDTATVEVYGIGYLDPLLHHHQLGCPRSHAGVLQAVMASIRRHHADRAQQAVCVVMAHAFVTGGEPSDSERNISVGGVQDVPLSTFEGADYVALGHLHGRATLAPHIRYCGSPLPYSFSEHQHVKGSWLVDCDATGFVDAEFIPAPSYRKLRHLTGTLEELLTAEEFSDAEDAFCDITLTDQLRPADAMTRVHSRFPHAVVLKHEPPQTPGVIKQYSHAVAEADDLTISNRFLEHVRGVPPTAAEQDQLQQAWEAIDRQDHAKDDQ